ncbi:hypothetical protein BDF14DRAFT_1882941 [Spinellus fusiger]|nr:hypothetical protein BDF14DRAFT_1882941 [Spinellus fusiger]
MSLTTINFKKNEIPTCNVCQKIFKTKGNLKSHLSTHKISMPESSSGPLPTITTVFRVEEEDDFDSSNNTFEETASVDDIFPFSTKLEMIMHCFFSKNESCFSKALAGKVMSLCQDVRDATLANPQEKMPALDRILNLEKRAKSNVPKFPTTTHQVAVVKKCKGLPPTTTTQEFIMNKPSKDLRLLTTNPLKTTMLSALPDRTPEQSVLPQQGEKWKTPAIPAPNGHCHH